MSHADSYMMTYTGREPVYNVTCWLIQVGIQSTTSQKSQNQVMFADDVTITVLVDSRYGCCVLNGVVYSCKTNCQIASFFWLSFREGISCNIWLNVIKCCSVTLDCVVSIFHIIAQVFSLPKSWNYFQNFPLSKGCCHLDWLLSYFFFKPVHI